MACISRAIVAFLCSVTSLGSSLAATEPSKTAVSESAYPTRPITILVGFAPGGPTDIVARLLAEGMREQLGGHPVVVVNRPGVSGGPGALATIDARPDGYTLHAVTVGTIALPLLLKAYEKLDLVNSFSSISYLAYSPSIMMVPSSSPARNLKEFIDLAKARPGTLNFGSTGGSADLNGALWMHMVGIRLQSVSYKGSAPAMTALASGEVDFAYDTPASAKPFIDSNRVRVIGVITDKPWPVRPDLPLAKEFAPGYQAVASWWGLNAPKGLPKNIVEKLSAVSRAAVNQPEIKNRLAALSILVDDGGPEMLDRRTAETLDIWRKAAELSGLKPQ